MDLTLFFLRFFQTLATASVPFEAGSHLSLPDLPNTEPLPSYTVPVLRRLGLFVAVRERSLTSDWDQFLNSSGEEREERVSEGKDGV